MDAFAFVFRFKNKKGENPMDSQKIARRRTMKVAVPFFIALGLVVGGAVASASADSGSSTPASDDLTPNITTVWQMASVPANDTTPTYPQKIVSSTDEAYVTLNVSVPTTCGTAYQLDSGKDVQGYRDLIAKGVLNGPQGVEDSQYINAGGWSVAYKIVINPPCDTSYPITSVPNVTFTDACQVSSDAVIFTPTTATDHFTYVVSDKRVNGVGNVTVTAVASKGYSFASGVKTVFTHDFTSADCIVPVAPAVPVFKDVCGPSNDTVILPADTQYFTYSQSGTDTITVTATATAGYVFASGVTTTWTYTDLNTACATTTSVKTPPTLASTGADMDLVPWGIGLLGFGLLAFVGTKFVRRMRANKA